MASALNISSLYLHSVQKLDNKQTEMLCSHNGELVTRGKQHGIFKATNTKWIAALKNKKIELDFMNRYQCRYQRKKRLSSLWTCISRYKTGTKSKPHQPTWIGL